MRNALTVIGLFVVLQKGYMLYRDSVREDALRRTGHGGSGAGITSS